MCLDLRTDDILFVKELSLQQITVKSGRQMQIWLVHIKKSNRTMGWRELMEVYGVGQI
jgi:hypothetical protein